MKEILEMKRTHDRIFKKRQMKMAMEKPITSQDNLLL